MAGKIVKISGPLVVAKDIPGARLFDVVKVGDEGLTGEIIEIRSNQAWIQVYEETSGVTVGEKVETTGSPLSVELGPGILEGIYDGIQRPLEEIAKQGGIFITRGIDVPSLDHNKKWKFEATSKKGDKVIAGDVLGTVKETELILHKILVPPTIEGEIEEIKSGEFKVTEVIATIKNQGVSKEITMSQKWPIRKPRPFVTKFVPTTPLVTGQRVFDTFFPIAKGGVAAIPGPFGSGKSVSQQQIAKWCDAQIIVYIGCGERGNEMTDVLKEFPELKDPISGKPLMQRTILIANTSNMPIAAREASIYTGITIAEYFRDQGYDVALMADSTSRWAEALREISGRLEEMPGEEGYPAYLTSRIAEFYERAGKVQNQGSEKTEGSVTVIGAVSPPGGDLSEPVSQSTLQVAKVFWALDSSLAYARHYPAINWLTSYSRYDEEVEKYYASKVDPEYPVLRRESLELLQKEAELLEIIRIVGMDSLSIKDRLVLDVAKSLREDYLQQFAFDPIDTYSSLEKQYLMLKAIITFYNEALAVAEMNEDFNVDDLLDLEVKEEIAKMKLVPEENLDQIKKLIKKIEVEVGKFKPEAVVEGEDQPDYYRVVRDLDDEV